MNHWIHGPQCPGTAVARRVKAGKAKKHVTMGVRPSVRMIGEGLATLDLRGSDQGACARVRNGAWQVLREGTRRLVPIGTSSSSCLQSISPVS